MYIYDDDSGAVFYKCDNFFNPITQTELSSAVDKTVEDLEDAFLVKINLEHVKSRLWGVPDIISLATRKVVLDYMERRRIIDALLSKINKDYSLNATNLNQCFLSRYEQYQEEKTNY